MSSRRTSFSASLRGAAAWAAAACLCACIAGGTGTDTENGIAARVTDGDGKPLAGVTLALFDPAHRPDLGQPLADPVGNAPQTLISDAKGYVRLELKAPGKFVVEGMKDGKTLFFDTLAVADLDQDAIFTFRARPSHAFKGKVRLASGMRVDSGRVFIRGTRRWAAVDAAGGYDLGILPEDASRMALGARLVSSPVAVLRAQPAATVLDTTGRYICASIADSASKSMVVNGESAQADTASLDAATVARAVKSCESLERGSVINISEAKGSDSPMAQTSNLLVLNGKDTTNFTSPKTLEPVLVPLSCVPSAGKESTTYDLSVTVSADGGDIQVQDVSSACLTK